MNEAECINEICALRARLAEVEAERDRWKEAAEAYNREAEMSGAAALAAEAERDELQAVVSRMRDITDQQTARLAEVEKAVKRYQCKDASCELCELARKVRAAARGEGK